MATIDYKQKIKDYMNSSEVDTLYKSMLNNLFPELAELEDKDERIRKSLSAYFAKFKPNDMWDADFSFGDIVAWLEKQVPVDEDEIVKGIRRGVAISLMNHIDANSKGMCLSNMECEDIENAIVNEDWDKVYGYMKNKLEKQGEQNKQEKDIILCRLWHNESEKCLDKKAYILFRSTYDNTWNVFTASTINWNVVDKWAYLSDIINIVNKDSKQCEKKPDNKIEPKFKVGDYLIEVG